MCWMFSPVRQQSRIACNLGAMNLPGLRSKSTRSAVYFFFLTHRIVGWSWGRTPPRPRFGEGYNEGPANKVDVSIWEIRENPGWACGRHLGPSGIGLNSEGAAGGIGPACGLKANTRNDLVLKHLGVADASLIVIGRSHDPPSAHARNRQYRG